MRVLILLTTLALVGACALYGRGEDRVISAVDYYCSNITAPERAIARGRVNQRLAENGQGVLVWCTPDESPF